MMRVMIVRAAEHKIEPLVVDEVHQAYATAGLAPGTLEHNIVQRPNGIVPGIGVFVFQSALTEHQDKQSYFVLNHKLFGGNAVVYCFNEGGETVDASIGPVIFLADQWEVETAIRAGEIQRPVIKNDNNDVVWRWPERYIEDAAP